MIKFHWINDLNDDFKIKNQNQWSYDEFKEYEHEIQAQGHDIWKPKPNLPICFLSVTFDDKIWRYHLGILHLSALKKRSLWKNIQFK